MSEQGATAVAPGRAAEPGAALQHAFQLQQRGRYGEAAALFEAVLATAPDQPDALHGLGLCRLQTGDAETAVTLLRRALAIAPTAVALLNNLGGALQALNRQEEAVGLYERALALDQRSADAHNNLAAARKTLGQIDAAIRGFETAIALAPDRPAFYRNLVEARTVQPDDPVMPALVRLGAEEARFTRDARQQIHFALAKAYADLGQDARGFDHLLVGNRLRREDTSYDERNTLALMARIAQAFDGATMRRLAGCGSASDLPIFVVGMPRSGTTLVEQILASHPAVVGVGERSDVETIATSLGDARAPFPEAITRCEGATLQSFGDALAARLRDGATKAARVVDKMPANFRFLGLIHLMLPAARIIHVRRHPVDTCLSCHAILFMGHQPFAYDLGELGRYYAAYARLMAHWQQTLPASVLLTIDYEDIVADLEGQARRMLAHCGLGWDAACLRFHETARPVRTASAVQVRQPLYRHALRRWRPAGAPMATLLAALGAETMAGTEDDDDTGHWGGTAPNAR